MEKVNVPVRVNRKLHVFAMIITFMIIYIAPIQNVYAQGTNYYVGGTGASDSNLGTSAQPFATIQKAATVAIAGDIVNIRAGIYRETITPVNSGSAGNPIIYQPDGTASVVISGLNEVDETGWEVHSGNIYKKTIELPVDNATGLNANLTSNTTLGGNQLFKDGNMVIRARWPNASNIEATFDRNNNRQRQQTVTWYNGSLTDDGLPSGLKGGTIWVQGWYQAQTKTIIAQTGNKINYSNLNPDLRMQQWYFVTGTLSLLDQANEWHYDNETNTLYLWQPGGGSPIGIEYKARNWGFNLSDKSNILLTGLQFMGCEVMGNTNTNNVTIDNVRLKYPNHVFRMDAADQGFSDVIFWNVRQTGVRLLGDKNIVKNSEFKYVSCQGVMAGPNALIQNNLFEYVNQNADYGSPVAIYESADNVKIIGNTMGNTGRSSFDWGEIHSDHHKNCEIAYNDMYNWNMLSYDGGAMYGGRHIDITGTVVHHNWIHDSKAMKVPNTTHSGTSDHLVGICAGIYYDQAVGPSINHHNVLWNNYECDFHTWQWDNVRNAGKNYLYNNVFATDAGDDYYSHRSYLTVVTQYFDVMRNNIFRDDVVINWIVPSDTWGDVKNCLMETQNPKIVNVGHGGLKGRLKTDSPGIDAGVEIPGITDGSIGKPDIGAYEIGGTDWVPGYKANGYVPDYYATEEPWKEEPKLPEQPNPDPGTFFIDDSKTGTGENQYEFVGSWGNSTPEEAFMKTDHYTASTDDYYQIKFTGTQVKIYGEKNSGFGIVAISVDGGEETMIDCYNSTRIVNTLLYTSADLPRGSHTVKVRITGTKNENSSATWHTADRAVITTGTITIDDRETGTGENKYEFVGASWQSSMPSEAYMQTDHYSGKAGDYYQIRFNGTQVQVYGEKNTAFCIVAISIDGGEETMVDCYSATRIVNTLLYTSPVLEDGTHIVKVRLTGTKNSSSTSYWHTADRVVVYSDGTTGVADLQNTKKRIIYPNPGDGRYFLKSTNNEIKSIEVYNVSGGKVLCINNLNQEGQEINISGLPDGLYVARLFDGKEHFTEKLIKQK